MNKNNKKDRLRALLVSVSGPMAAMAGFTWTVPVQANIDVPLVFEGAWVKTTMYPAGAVPRVPSAPRAHPAQRDRSVRPDQTVRWVPPVRKDPRVLLDRWARLARPASLGQRVPLDRRDWSDHKAQRGRLEHKGPEVLPVGRGRPGSTGYYSPPTGT
jgi:hypothetical protein